MTENVTNLHYDYLPGLILGAFCTMFRAGPVWNGLGTQFGPKATNTNTYVLLPGRTYGRISDFSFGGRTENRYEVVFELPPPGADFRGILYQCSSLAFLKGFGAKSSRKTEIETKG